MSNKLTLIVARARGSHRHGAPVAAGELITGAAASSILAGITPEYWNIQ